MSDEAKKRSWGWIGWALLAALVLYPLSIGPATAFVMRSESESALEAWSWLYWPLEPFRSPSVNQAIETYEGWWLQIL